MIRVYERPTIEVEKFECEKGFMDSWDENVFGVEPGTSNGSDDVWI